jgi:GntR family transcriptional regulator
MPTGEPLPLYYRTELALRAALASGLFKPGDRLPPEWELAQRYRVSRVTIRTALQRLEEDGLVLRARGRGTFVRLDVQTQPKVERHLSSLLDFEEDILRTGLTPHVRVLEVGWAVPPDRMRALLELVEAREALHVRRVGAVDGTPLWFESRYCAPAIGALLQHEDLTTASMTRLIERLCHRRVVATRFHIEAESASPHLASLLHLKEGTPLLACEFAFFAENHVPLEAARAVFRADRYSFSVELDHSRQTHTYLSSQMSYHPPHADLVPARPPS